MCNLINDQGSFVLMINSKFIFLRLNFFFKLIKEILARQRVALKMEKEREVRYWMIFFPRHFYSARYLYFNNSMCNADGIS